MGTNEGRSNAMILGSFSSTPASSPLLIIDVFSLFLCFSFPFPHPFLFFFPLRLFFRLFSPTERAFLCARSPEDETVKRVLHLHNIQTYRVCNEFAWKNGIERRV